MKEAYGQAEQFLNDIFRTAGFDLRAQASEETDGCVLNIDGSDSPLVRSEGGELLDALEDFVNQSFGRELSEGERFICDVDHFLSIREMELGAMRWHGAYRGGSSGLRF